MSLSTASSTVVVSSIVPPVPTTVGLDEIVLSTLDRRTFARSKAKRNASRICQQLRKTQALIQNAATPRETQNAAIAELVTLCGSENYAAVQLNRPTHFVQLRNFEASQTFLDLRSLWPDTESTLLLTLIAKSKADPGRFDQYMKPFLDSRKGQKLLRSEFTMAWNRALNNGLLPEEKILLEKVEAENMTEMVLAETTAVEQELKVVREARAALEAKVAALEAALGHQGCTQQEGATVTGGLLNASLAMTMENLMRGKGAVTLEGLLCYVEQMLSDRVMILPSAWKSAKESDKAGFSPVEPVADLLFKLARDCVDKYRQGGHFLPATILGAGYADSDGQGLMTTQGLKNRTFSYNGKTVPMMTHLKIGTGWNKGTTFRAHFCFDADLGKVVIGHFGKHLDH